MSDISSKWGAAFPQSRNRALVTEGGGGEIWFNDALSSTFYLWSLSLQLTLKSDTIKSDKFSK
jgi:hypothetical protein